MIRPRQRDSTKPQFGPSALLLMTNLPSTPDQPNKNQRFLSFAGSFFRDSNQIHLTNTQKLLIRERREYTLTRPKYYLVLEVEGAETYVSSMFPSKIAHRYYADYLGIKYAFDFTESDKVQIAPRVSPLFP